MILYDDLMGMVMIVMLRPDTTIIIVCICFSFFLVCVFLFVIWNVLWLLLLWFLLVLILHVYHPDTIWLWYYHTVRICLNCDVPIFLYYNLNMSDFFNHKERNTNCSIFSSFISHFMYHFEKHKHYEFHKQIFFFT